MRNAPCFLGSLRNRKGGGPRRRLAVELWQRWHACHLANADDANLSLQAMGWGVASRCDLQARGSKARRGKVFKHSDLSNESIGGSSTSILISLSE